jgi:hypothetical protein
MRLALLMVLSLALGGVVLAAGEFSSGFEEGTPPAGWTLSDGGISTVTTERSHSGGASLKIVDPDAKAGSEARTAAIPVEAGDVCAVSLWGYLDSGDGAGLGVYLEYTDGAGKRLDKESEASVHRSAFRPGEWTRMSFTATVPQGAAKVCLRLHTFSTSVVTCYVDDVELRVIGADAVGPAASWRGGTLDWTTHRVWPCGVRWEHGVSATLTRDFRAPQDWSKYGAVHFWMYSPAANNSSFIFVINSENPATEGSDYWGLMVKVDWEGWKEFTIPFRELEPTRQPLGWDKVAYVYFTATGWGQTLNPATVLVLDGFELLPPERVSGLPSDEEFFASLNLELPELAAVKQAVAVGDYRAARKALADHIRNRTSPKWMFDWRDRPSKGVQVPGPEADRAPDQWDYYSTFLTVDWEGWKHFTLTKEDFSPKAMVEGQGIKTKMPIGWHWIQYIALNAQGWGLTPDPNTSLVFDDIRLVGKDKTTVISDFEGEDTGWTGLVRTEDPVKSGKGAGAWRDMVTTTGIRCNRIPHDWTAYDALDFWVYSPKATGARVVMVLDSDVPAASAAAEKALRREFDYPKGPGQTGTITFGPQIDWTANPTEGEARTHLWNEALNRQFHFGPLSEAYWNTGQDKYAAEIAAQIVDWATRMPRPMLSNGNRLSHFAWQTLTTSIRLSEVWPNALYRCMDAPSFTDDVLITIMKSYQQQAQHLVRWPSAGNWLTSECNGLFTAGVLFPEFLEAREWRRVAIERLYKQLDEEVYPDGMEYELAAGYNTWVVSEFAHILELADLNNLRGELPGDYQAKLEKMFNYLLLASMPDGRIPGLNDSGPAPVRELLATGFKLFPERLDFEYVATSRQRGTAPQVTSHAFPWTGHYVMRTGWDANATYLLLDAGPFGYAHQHEDKLTFVLWAKGRQLVLDPGNFSYDQSRWRRYVLATYGHNTVLVDGLGQARAGKRETYFWPRPWQGASPPENDARWATTPQYDFASGVYSDGYGPQHLDVTHTRRVLLLKDLGVFVITDTLKPGDDKEHQYQALFHLDTTEAAVTDGVVTTQNPGQANLVITPAPGLGVEIVKGKSEEPVQGWANHPWRPIPTAIYTAAGTGTVRMAFALEPVGAGETPKVAGLKVLPGVTDGVALELTLADGTRWVVVERDAASEEAVSVAGVQATREVTVASGPAEGTLTERFAFDPQKP